MDKEKTIKAFMKTLLVAATPAIASCSTETSAPPPAPPSAPSSAPSSLKAPAPTTAPAPADSGEFNLDTKGKAVCGIRG